MAVSQTVTKLSGFREMIGLPHLKNTAGTPLPPYIKSLGWPCSAEFSCTGDQSAIQSWDFWRVSPSKAFVWETDGQDLEYVARMREWGQLLSPL